MSLLFTQTGLGDCFEVQTADNKTVLGDLVRDVDGYFYYWPDHSKTGCYPEYMIRAIADKLAELNKPWDAIVAASQIPEE